MMFIKQLSVYLENHKGRLAEFATVLAHNHIDLLAASVADTSNFGMLRAIAADCEKACAVLRDSGYTVNLTEVLAVGVPDAPGGLARVLQLLHDADISIEYLYSLVRRVGEQAIIICRVDQPARAEQILAQNGVKMLSQEEISA